VKDHIEERHYEHFLHKRNFQRATITIRIYINLHLGNIGLGIIIESQKLTLPFLLKIKYRRMSRSEDEGGTIVRVLPDTQRQTSILSYSRYKKKVI